MSKPAKRGVAHWILLLLLLAAIVYVVLYIAGVLK